MRPGGPATLRTLGPRVEGSLVALVRENAGLLALSTGFALLAYGYALVSPSLSLDEEIAPAFGELGRGNRWSVALYRWGLVAFQMAVLPGSNLPFLRPMLALLLLSLTATLYARMLPTTRTAQAFFAIVFVTVPTFAYAMTFSFMCVELVLALLLFVLGLRYLVAATECTPVAPRPLAAALVLWILAPSFYQDYGIVLTGFLVYAFFQLAEDRRSLLRAQASWFVPTLAISVAVYGGLSLAIAHAAGVGTGAYLLGYLAPERTGAVLAQFVRRMRGFYLHPSVYGTGSIRVAALALPLLGASVPGPASRRCALAALAVPIALAPFAYGLGVVPPIRATSGLLFLVAGTAAFAVAHSRPSVQLLVKAAVLWLVLGNCVAVNNMFHYESLAWEADRMLATELAGRIHAVAPDLQDVPGGRVVFAGSYKRTLPDELPGPDFWVGMFDTWGDNQILRRKRALGYAGFPDFRLASAEDYEASRPTLDAMPSWPAPGAVARHGDLVLVKLGPLNGYVLR